MNRLLLVFAAIVGLAVIGVQAHAAVDSTDILIKVLVDKGIITEDDAASVRAEIAGIRQDEDAAKTSYGVSGKRPIKIGGVLQARYTNSSQSGSNSTFEAKRATLVISGDATTVLDFYTQADFAGSKNGVTGASFAKGTTTTGAFGKPVLLDAQIGYKLAQGKRLDFGQQKIPFSVESLTSDAYLDLINRSQVVEALVPGRDTGNQGRGRGRAILGPEEPDRRWRQDVSICRGHLQRVRN